MAEIKGTSSEMFYEEMPMQIRVDAVVSDRYEDIGVNLIAVQIEKKLNEELYDLFLDSPFFEKYNMNDRKADKADSIKIFNYFNSKLGESYNYHIVDKLLAIVEFFSMNYKVIFGELKIIQREEIIRELARRHKLSDKLACVRIF